MNEGCTGHCLCGEIQFRTRNLPKWIAYCHCDSCRRATGGIVAAYAGFFSQDIDFLRGTPKLFPSSEGVMRGSCAQCASPIFYQSQRWPDETHLFLGLIDQAERLIPQAHVYTQEQLPWFHVQDSLPRYATLPSDESLT